MDRRRFVQSLPVATALSSLRAEEQPDEVAFGSGTLEAAAARFDCTPPVGLPAPTYGENPVIREVQGPLETRLFALRQGNLCIAWSNSDFDIPGETRPRLAKALGISLDHTLHSVTHNHSGLETSKVFAKPAPGSYAAEYLKKFDAAARELASHFVPVTVAWGTAEESTIVYNRKGRRPDGTTYFMREEDRVKLPGDFTGHIDPQASVIVFRTVQAKPVLVLTHYTGHPVISYQLETPVINPDYCGWALIDLLESYGKDRPVGAFLQGCCGDINAKGMFSGAALARESGRKLGRAFLAATRNLHRVDRPRLGFARGVARVPYGPLPPLEVLERDRRELLDFQRRVEAGDPNTLHVLGYNFSETMKMGYRKNLATPFLRWTDWAIDMQRSAKSRPEEYCPIRVQAVTLGDIALVTSQGELFVDIGLGMRKASPYSLTVPAAYSNGVYPNYIGTSRDVGDREYMSAFYRYIQKPAYAKPAGDTIAGKAVDLLRSLQRQS